MKVAVAAKGKDLNAQVCERFGSCPYILIIDTETLEYEVLPAGNLSPRSFPAEVLTNILRMGASTVIAGFMSPRLVGPLTSKGIEVVTGVRGSVAEVVDAYRKKKLDTLAASESVINIRGKTAEEVRWALRKTGREFLSIVPVLIGVILLIGLCEAFINKKFLLSIFSGNPLEDSIMGAFWGSILIGNPVNSYVIGDVLLKNGVSLYAVAAFLTTWVTVGFVQLPVEIEILGARFAISRLLVSVLVFIMVAYSTAWLMQLF